MTTEPQALHATPMEAYRKPTPSFCSTTYYPLPQKTPTNIRYLKQNTVLGIAASDHFDSTFAVLRGQEEARARRQLAEFLRLKGKYDHEERFQSGWYRHSKAISADIL